MKKKVLISIACAIVLGSIILLNATNVAATNSSPPNSNKESRKEMTVSSESKVESRLLTSRMKVAENPPIDTENQTELTTRMLNSIDYYDMAEGIMIHESAIQEMKSETTFSYIKGSGKTTDSNRLTLEDTTYEYSDSMKKENPDYEDRIVSSLEDTTYTTIGVLDDNIQKPDVKVFMPVESNSSLSAKRGIKEETIEDRINIGDDGVPMYEFKTDNNMLGESKIVLLPEDFVLGILKDFNLWSIDGEEVFAGIATKLISGKLPSDYAERYNAEEFVMNVDPLTGVMFNFQASANGKIMKSIYVKEFTYTPKISTDVFSISADTLEE